MRCVEGIKLFTLWCQTAEEWGNPVYIQSVRKKSPFAGFVPQSGITVFTSSVMWAVWTEKESHETKVQFRPLAYHIFYNTDTWSPFCLYKRGGIESKGLKKKLWKNFGKKISRKKTWESKKFYLFWMK